MPTSRPRIPPAEHELSLVQIRELLTEQAPHWAELPIDYLSEGWDNCMYQLGGSLLLRLPRRALGNEFMQKEQTWLPRIPQPLPIAIPELRFAGQPTDFYPYYWSVLSHLPGERAIAPSLAAEEAIRLATFYRKLHQVATPDTPENAYRGVPLSARQLQVEERLHAMTARGIDTDPYWDIWQTGLQAPPYAGPARWIHGDSHPKNVLIHEGRFSAILDWGDFTAGDPATDLAAFWMYFDDPKTRRAGLAHYGAAPDLVRRARAWAIMFASVLMEVGWAGDEDFAIVAEFTFDNLTHD